LASAVPDEGRFPKFNIVAVPESEVQRRSLGDVWQFSEPRVFSVDEIRRLAPAVDSKKSAILARWKSTGWEIAGLVDLGTSWSRARLGLQYHYQLPACLFIQVDRPGKIRVYQGQFHIASLSDGKVEREKTFEASLVLHRQTHNGLNKVWNDITYPKIEEPREYENFQFIAFWNAYAALANCVNEEGHGGAIVIAPVGRPVIDKELRIKYRQDTSILRDAFVGFMNSRHRAADLAVRIETGEGLLQGEYAMAEMSLTQSHLQFVEAIRFVAKLSGCDGAIVVSEDLRLLGFGAEIRSELKPGTVAREVIDELRKI
jgi:hypothetical protein